MTNRATYTDGLYRLAQIGSPTGIQLVRLIELDQDNQYTAKGVEFDGNDSTIIASDTTIIVTNLAEPADEDGLVPEDTDAIAIDVEGRWIVFIRPAEEGQTGTSQIPARVVSSLGSASYTMREQDFDSSSDFIDKQGASNFTARNLAELSLGPGAAVDDDTIVIVTPFLDSNQTDGFSYVFDHPAYAKYLD